ncbi:cob(I)yrinic acid a,c-diamide adenosyltransferase [Coraliomargarita algicola]|uniref:corrinoid adenosyltransferase n=1 Tax=Coraliomargarita algicola TaxID=3092156 RepID=A0ABZ0RH88_9BACT|nr:cob(I)yrinic acid a,c-diamide adenosyltransferase [Coraliomargarita sp. J2-16]WPJ94614.1 cob(I)yrinic acid a,c-diamide adenosyltransferase [Coraliomargarita sp. J2-16]
MTTTSSKQHYLQIYTGNGKGKTTAASGLVLRAVAAGWMVFFGQFIKNNPSGELRIMKERFPEVTVEQFGRGFFLRRDPEPADRQAAQDGLNRLAEVMDSGAYRMIIADEIMIALKYKLISEADVLALVERNQGQAELVFTGRYAPEALIKRADLVSEVVPVKHYMEVGAPARRGIES